MSDERVERTQNCPSCGCAVTMVPYDIGSGPEMSCSHCEWCWGADGQPLDPKDPIKSMPPELREQLGLDGPFVNLLGDDIWPHPLTES